MVGYFYLGIVFISISTTDALTFSCGFDTESFCDEWHNVDTDDLQWTQTHGKTMTKGTGPLYGQGGKGYYLFVEGSSTSENDLAQLVSNIIDSGDGEIDFYFMLYSTNKRTMGSLSVFVKYVLSGERRLLGSIITGSKDRKWKKKTLPFRCTERCIIIFEARVGNGPQSDIAIDEVKVTCIDQNIQDLTLPNEVVPLEEDVLREKINCRFNKNLCNWKQSQNDTFDWELHQDSTPTKLTGPRDGRYVYTPVSFPMLENNTAILETDELQTVLLTQCVKFMYHMYGDKMGKLELIATLEDGEIIDQWSCEDNQGDNWIYGYLTLRLKELEKFKLMFKATRGPGIHGEIAVRDVILTRMECKEDEPYDCHFDKNYCSWKNDRKMDIGNWKRGLTNEPGYDTIPDHTTGTRSGGYAYVMSGHQRSILYVKIDNPKKLCIEFWHISYGNDEEGTLYLFASEQTDLVRQRELWKHSGELNDWKKEQVEFEFSKPYRLGFLANGKYSMKAVDDIKITEDKCAS